MWRVITVSLLAAGVTAGCAGMPRLTSAGYYCEVGTEEPCPSHEGSGDCQPCPSSASVDSGTADSTSQ